MKNQISFTGLAHAAIVLTFTIALMYVAKSILVPIAFAMFFSFLLYPACKFLERKLPPVIAILLTFFTVILILAGIGFFFGTQFYSLFENIKNFGANISISIEKLLNFLENSILHKGNLNLDNPEKLVNPVDVIQGTISTSTGFLVGFGLIFIYLFIPFLQGLLQEINPVSFHRERERKCQGSADNHSEGGAKLLFWCYDCNPDSGDFKRSRIMGNGS